MMNCCVQILQIYYYYYYIIPFCTIPSIFLTCKSSIICMFCICACPRRLLEIECKINKLFSHLRYSACLFVFCLFVKFIC